MNGSPTSIAPSPNRLLTPPEILQLDESGADALLERLEATVPVLSSLVDLPGDPFREAIVFGDSHGDWHSTVRVADQFLFAPETRCLVGLGDYIDRAPDDCGEGSVANAFYLLQLVAQFPGRVFLLQGNHETVRRLSVVPHDLPEEVDLLWGPEPDRYNRLVGLLERGPLAAVSPSGVYLAHAGFPRGALPLEWRDAFDNIGDDRLAEIVWAECRASRNRRGATVAFSESDLMHFLSATGQRVMLRGHDADLAGRSVFHDRCLTLHSTRLYEQFGGVLFARVPLDHPVRTTQDVLLEHVETEGKEFPPPS
ncbi:MAG: metallophosphoesterase [Thermoplasmata archaeon]